MSVPSALDLTLPSGCARTPNCVVLAPTVDDDRALWRDVVVRAAGAAVRRGGSAAVVTPRRARGAVERRLGALAGVDLAPFLLLPSADAPTWIVSLADAPLRFVLRHAPVAPGLPRLAGAGAVRAVLGRVAPGASVAVRPRGTARHDWLSRWTPAPIEHIAIRPSWRGDAAAVVVHGFTAGADPVVVAKVARGEASAAACSREAETLDTLGPGAEAAGASVPRRLALDALCGRPVLIETALPGTPAARLLAGRPDRVADLLAHLGSWLRRWHRATCTPTVLDADRLHALVGAPLRRVEADVSPAVAAHVRALADAVRGQTAPLVAAHHDLTMQNVLLGGAAPLGVVDWEEAEPLALPLGDWLYAATDLALVAGAADRLDAAQACTAPGGRFARTVGTWTSTFADDLGMSADLVALARLAVWLRHAAHEADAARPDGRRPFLDVLRWQASRPAEARA